MKICKISVNLCKCDQPLSKVCDFKNGLGKFVRIKFIQDDLSGLLKNVGSFIKLCR